MLVHWAHMALIYFTAYIELNSMKRYKNVNKIVSIQHNLITLLMINSIWVMNNRRKWQRTFSVRLNVRMKGF